MNRPKLQKKPAKNLRKGGEAYWEIPVLMVLDLDPQRYFSLDEIRDEIAQGGWLTLLPGDKVQNSVRRVTWRHQIAVRWSTRWRDRLDLVTYLSKSKNKRLLKIRQKGRDIVSKLKQDQVGQYIDLKSYHKRKNTRPNFGGEQLVGTKGQYLIYYGPPGSGKTREAKRKASELLKLKDKDWKKKRLDGSTIPPEKWSNQVSIVQFHPAYSYEEFIEGIRPVTDQFGDIKYQIIYGPFMQAYTKARGDYFQVPAYRCKNKIYPIAEIVRLYSLPLDAEFLECKQPIDTLSPTDMEISFNFDELLAERNKSAKIEYISVGLCVAGARPQPFVLIVDEINRAKVSKVFGELLYAIADLDDERRAAVHTLYSKTRIEIPPQLNILATLNNTDHSVDDIDQALLRRFDLIQVLPNYVLMRNGTTKNKKDSIDKVFEKYIGNFGVKPSDWLESLNNKICESKGSTHFQIAHSYFFDVRNAILNCKGNKKSHIGKRMFVRMMFRQIIPTVISILGNRVSDLRKAFEGLLDVNIFGAETGRYVPGWDANILRIINEEGPVKQTDWKRITDIFNLKKPSRKAVKENSSGSIKKGA